MANVSYGFNQSRPRTQVFLDASGLGTQNVNSEKPLVLIGSAEGGQPGVAFAVSSYAQAKKIFRSGDLLDAIEMAWNASTNVGGAGPIFAVRADGATQGTLTSGGLVFTSKLYGVGANNIQVQLADNSLTSSKTLSVYYQPDGYTKVYDNLGNMFTIQYTGALASGAVEIDVDATSHLATTLKLYAGTAGTESLVKSYALGSGVFQDLNVLVNDISNLGNGDWTVTLNTLGGNKNIQTQYLDALTKVVCKASAVTVKAIGADIQNQTSVDPYISVAPQWGTVVSNISLTALAGATTTVPAATWTTLFDAVAGLGAYYIVPLTSAQALHGELAQFLDDQAQQGNMMRGLVGGGLNESSAQLQARQAGIRDSRVGLVGNSGKRTMSDGRSLNFKGYLYAAMIAGIASGLPVGEPITYKHTNITALDGSFLSDDLDQLNNAGVIMSEFVRTRNGSYFRIVSDPTTYNDLAEPVQNRISLGEVSDFLSVDLRTLLDEQFIGSRLGNTSASIIKNAVESYLDQQVIGGTIVSYDPSNVSVVINGNTATINFTVQPAQGLDYINCFITYQQDQLSA
jgi:hypothetical protein